MRTIELTREEYQILEMSLSPAWRFINTESKEPTLVLMKPDYKPIVAFTYTKEH